MHSTGTILGDIAATISDAAPGWSVEIGFSTDVGEWITSNKSTGKTILLTFDNDEPRAYREGGLAVDFRMSLSLFMRTRSTATKFAKDIWPQYKAIRSALNGITVTEDGVAYIVVVGAGSAGVANGFAVPTLQLTVQ